MFDNSAIIVAVSGASGFDYSLCLIKNLVHAKKKVIIILSPAAYVVAKLENHLSLPGNPKKLETYLAKKLNIPPESIIVYSYQDWQSPLASGGHNIQKMVVCPCTSGTLAAIAHGLSDNLLERAADVMLKERRKLILVHRETPLSTIHLENALTLSRMGAVYLPANPGFYHEPTSIEDLIDFIVARILDQLGIPNKLIARWGE